VIWAIAFTFAFAILATALVLMQRDRVRACRWVLWAGLIIPLLLTEQRFAAGVTDPSLTYRDALRAAIPAGAILLASLAARPVRHGTRRPLLLPLCMYAAWAALTALWSVSPMATILKVVVLALQYVLLGMLVRRYSTRAHLVHGVVTVLYALTFSAALGAILAPGVAFRDTERGFGRLWGVFPDITPNSLGLVAAIALIGWVARQGPKFVVSGAAWPVSGAVIGVVLLATRTRYTLAIAALCSAYLVMRMRGGGLVRRASLTLAAAGAIGGLAYTAQSIVDYVVREQTAEQLLTLTGRTKTWARALDVAAERPWAGWGYYAGHRVHLSALPGTDLETSNLDNMWIESLVDVGVIGTFLLAMFVAAASREAFKGALLEGNERYFVQASVMAGLIASTVNPSLQTVGYGAIVFGVVLLEFAAVRGPRGHDGTRTERYRLGIVSGGLGSP
jgi:O-antigen ligase